LLLKLRIKTGVIWRNVYVLSYYHAILLLPEVVANSEGDENKEKPCQQARTTNRSNVTATTKQYPNSKTQQTTLTRKAAASK
jgi:hypothetical protein